MDTYTPEELDKIAMQIARQPGLYVPLPRARPPSPARRGQRSACTSSIPKSLWEPRISRICTGTRCGRRP